MSKLLGRLAARFGKVQLRGRQDVLAYLHDKTWKSMPELVLMPSLEDFQQASTVNQDPGVVVVHGPDVIRTYGLGVHPAWVGYQKYPAAVITAHSVANAMLSLYQNRGENHYNATLESLERAIEEDAARREASQATLKSLAERLDKVEGDTPEHVIEFIRTMLFSQFGDSHHSIRELYQNSAAATKLFPDGRIDIHLDPDQRIIRVEDNGSGMSLDTLDKVYFRIGASLNEFLKHAAGRFGMGAVSCYGIGHEYVTIDTRTAEGDGASVEVDAQLQRSDYAAPKRQNRGTTVEIKLSKDADVDFGRLEEIVRTDCPFNSTTPIYLHKGDDVEKINRPLSSSSRDALNFSDRIQGYVKRVAGNGRVDLLSHEIRLTTIELEGLEGVINCDDLETVWSRDVAVGPAYEFVIARLAQARRTLKAGKELDLSQLSLAARVSDYIDFLHSTILNPDRTPNIDWISANLDQLTYKQNGRNGVSIVSGSLSSARLPFDFWDHPGEHMAGFELMDKITGVYGASAAKLFSFIPIARNLNPKSVKGWTTVSIAGSSLCVFSSGFGLLLRDASAERLYDASGLAIGLMSGGALGGALVAPILLGMIAGITEGVGRDYGNWLNRRFTNGAVGYYVDQTVKELPFENKPSKNVLKKGLIPLLAGAMLASAMVCREVAAGAGEKAADVGEVVNREITRIATPFAVPAVTYSDKVTATEPTAIPYDALPGGAAKLTDGFQFGDFWPYAVTAAGGIIGMGLIYGWFKGRGREFGHYQGTLTPGQQEFLDSIKKELSLASLGDADIFYSGRPNKSARWAMREGEIALNMTLAGEYPAKAVALAYASHVLKDKERAGMIAKGILGDGR